MEKFLIQPKSGKSRFRKVLAGAVIFACIYFSVFYYLEQRAHQRVIDFFSLNGMTFETIETRWDGKFVAHNAEQTLAKGVETKFETLIGKISFFALKSKTIEVYNISSNFANSALAAPYAFFEDYTVYPLNSDINAVSGIDNISYKKATFPTLTYEIKTGDIVDTSAYTNIVLDNFEDGILEKVSVEKITSHHSSEDDSSKTVEDVYSTEINDGHVDKLNYKNLFNYFFKQSSANDNTNPYFDLLDSWSTGNVSTKLKLAKNSTLTLSAQSFKGSSISTRLMPRSLMEIYKILYSEEIYKVLSSGGENATQYPEERKIINTIYLDLLSAVGRFGIKVNGLSGKTSDVEIKTDKLELSYLDGLTNFAIDGFQIFGDNQKFGIDRFSISGLRFPNLMTAWKRKNESLQSGDMKTTGNFFTLNEMIPYFKTVRLSGLQFETKGVHASNNFVEEKSNGKKIDKLDIDANFSTGIIPQSLKIVLNNMKVPATFFVKPIYVPAPKSLDNTDDPFRPIHMDFNFDAMWQSDNETFKINEFSLKFAGIGDLLLNATIGNASEFLFSAEPIVIGAAASETSIKDANLSANFDGLIHYIENSTDPAWQQRVAELRDKIAVNTAEIFNSLPENFQNLGDNVESFIRDGGTLTIQAKAKSVSGVRLLDALAARTDPVAFMKKIDIVVDMKHPN